VVHASDLDCSQLETDVIQDVIALGQDSKNKLFDTIERLQSRLHGEKQCTDSEWRINYGHLSYYKIGDGTPDGVGCHDVPLMGLDVTGMEWPYDTNDKGVNHQEYPAATVRKGMCGSGIPGMVLQCTPEPIQNKYSYDRPTNKCPRVYCVTDADPLVAGEYWEDISNFVQDQVPRYIKGAIDTTAYQDCRIPSPPSPSPVASDLCEGKTQAETNLDFFQAEVTENTLHQPGGKLIYDNVGIVRDKPVNLVVTVAEGTTYTTSKPDMNGKTGGSMFGNINLMTKENDVQSGTGTFDFCFHDKDTNELVTVDSFLWSVYDIDERSADKKGIKEKLIMDTSQIEEYALWPNEDESEIKLFCENFTLWPYTSASQVNQLPCNDGERMVFHSSTQGVGADNPKDKDNMTEQQRRRSVQFFFKNKSCFTFTYSHYCPPDEAGNSKKCVWYGGGNMLFAGSAKQLIEEGECITQSPTQSPTDAPSETRSEVPSELRSDAPTVESSVSPTTASSGTPTTSAPTDVPTAAPTTSAPTTSAPTDVPTVAPTTSAPTTSAPTDAPTAAPTTSAPTTLSPTIKAVTRPPIITNGGDDDDDDLFFQPTCPADVKLIATHGSKDIDLERVVRIVSQDTSTVQVALNQGWEQEVSGGNANAIPTIDHVFYSYRTDIFDENCYEETSVMENKRIDTVTIQCNVHKPFALLEICVVDDITNGLLSVQDDATIPKCCHPTFPPNTPTVCYTIEVNCVTECEDDDAMDGIDTTNNGIVSRGLRGGSSY
jgi:hypothetical protein